MIFQRLLCGFGLHSKQPIMVSTPKEGLKATATSYDGKVVISTDKGTLSGWYCKSCSYVSVSVVHEQ